LCIFPHLVSPSSPWSCQMEFIQHSLLWTTCLAVFWPSDLLSECCCDSGMKHSFVHFFILCIICPCHGRSMKTMATGAQVKLWKALQVNNGNHIAFMNR
jgi:hypothetical protein